MRQVFSYYGSKSKRAHLYPQATNGLVIEPFAGSASYSVQLMPNDNLSFWFNDLNKDTCEVWKYLTSSPCLETIRAFIPDTMRRGTSITDHICNAQDKTGLKCPYGLEVYLRAATNRGTLGTGYFDAVTYWCAEEWPTIYRKLVWAIERLSLADIEVTGKSYTDLPNPPAVWFVDPPYNNLAGFRYVENNIDYSHLADWCLSRDGIVIVCEQMTATWLPFKPMKTYLQDQSGLPPRVEEAICIIENGVIK